MSMKKVFVLLIAPLCLAAAAPSLSLDEATGTLVGRVVDVNGNPLPGAALVVIGTNRTAVTDANGLYEITRVPEGTRTLEVSYLGFEPTAERVEVRASAIVRRDLVFTGAARLAREVTVVAEPWREGQAKALNQQKNAINIIDVVSSDFIGSFPDSNSAEATQRLPGITIQRDQGEGRYVLVRGTEARLNAMMLNGEVLASPEGDVRNVALDVIPADLLDSIVVTKALTPDMDADSIGGAVDLVTKTAPSEPRFHMNLGLGYNRISEKTLQNLSLSYGRRFADDKVGLMLGGSYFNTDRGSHNFEVAYDDGELDELEIRHYSINRKRYGFAGTLDFQPSLGTNFKIQGVFNQFDDQEYRRRYRNRVADERLEKQLKDRFESQRIYALSGLFEQLFAGGTKLDASLTYSYAHEDEPDALYPTFRQSDVLFDPNVSPDSIDPDNIQANPLNEDDAAYEFNGISAESNFTREKSLIGALNLSVPLAGGETSAVLKFGGKLKLKNKNRDNEVMDYESEEDLFYTDFIDPGWTSKNFLDGRYNPLGSFMSLDTGDRLLSEFALSGEKNIEEDLADYEAKENTYAGFGMGIVNIGPRLTLIPGVRYEYTDLKYTGYELLYDEGGDFVSLSPLDGTSNYGVLLPHLHLQYRLGQGSNFRAAFSRTLARPNYYDIVPYRLILQEDREIETGNAALKPTRSWNFDVMYQSFFRSLGVFSIGGFYKSLEDYIYLFRQDELYEGEPYFVIQPRNGESASLWGIEFNFQNRFSFLPAPFDGLGLVFNYTYIDSQAVFPDREGEKATLPGQSQSVGNLALSYEKGPFSARVSLNYHGRYIDEVGEAAAEDIIYDNRLQLDLRSNLRLSRAVSFFVEMLNLTDEPLRYYQGVTSRPTQEEYYRFWGSAGFRITF